MRECNPDAELYGEHMAEAELWHEIRLWYVKGKGKSTMQGYPRQATNFHKLGEKVNVMFCNSCQSENQSYFDGEVAIHFPGLKGLDKPIVWVFPKLLVCLHCGVTEFRVPETERRQLVESDTADGGTRRN